MFCSKCGAQNADGVRFCTSCGTPLGTTNSTTVLNPDAQPFEAAPVAPEAPAVPEIPVSPVAPVMPIAPQPQNDNKKKGLIIGIIAAVVVVIAIVGVVLAFTLGDNDSKKSDKKKDTKTTTEASDTTAKIENITNPSENPKFEETIMDSSNDFDTPDSKDVDYVGTWEMEVDYGKMFNEMLKETGVTPNFSSAKVKVIWTFKADGTYKTSLDRASSNSAMSSIKRDYKKYLVNLLAEEGMTVADFEASSGESIDDMINEMFDESEWNEIFETEGKYKFDGSRFYSSETLSEDIDTNDYVNYQIINSKELKLISSSSADDETAAMFPMTMRKR